MQYLTKNIAIAVGTHKDFSELEHQLIAAAIRARLLSQAPYSQYYVGAAVLSNGRIFSGCNVERASYSQTTHGEQCAVDTMIAAQGPSKIEALAVVGGPASAAFTLKKIPSVPYKPSFVIDVAKPCGHCRQIIWENCFGDSSVPIIMPTSVGYIAKAAISDLFPFCFGPLNLGIDYQKQKHSPLVTVTKKRQLSFASQENQ